MLKIALAHSLARPCVQLVAPRRVAAAGKFASDRDYRALTASRSFVATGTRARANDDSGGVCTLRCKICIALCIISRGERINSRSEGMGYAMPSGVRSREMEMRKERERERTYASASGSVATSSENPIAIYRSCHLRFSTVHSLCVLRL